jgi:hypothetical protein
LDEDGKEDDNEGDHEDDNDYPQDDDKDNEQEDDNNNESKDDDKAEKKKEDDIEEPIDLNWSFNQCNFQKLLRKCYSFEKKIIYLEKELERNHQRAEEANSLTRKVLFDDVDLLSINRGKDKYYYIR